MMITPVEFASVLVNCFDEKMTLRTCTCNVKIITKAHVFEEDYPSRACLIYRISILSLSLVSHIVDMLKTLNDVTLLPQINSFLRTMLFV